MDNPHMWGLSIPKPHFLDSQVSQIAFDPIRVWADHFPVNFQHRFPFPCPAQIILYSDR
jgi:hypothetical protein